MCVFYIVIGILCACVRWALDGHWKSSVWDQKDNKRYFFSRFCHIRVFSKKKEKVWTGFRKSRWKCESSIGPGGLVTRPLSPMAIYWQVSYKWSDINATRDLSRQPTPQCDVADADADSANYVAVADTQADADAVYKHNSSFMSPLILKISLLSGHWKSFLWD